MDTVTIGALTASALGMASEAMVKGAVGEAVKDGYKALKDKVTVWARSDVEALQENPYSPARRAVVAEVIDAKPADEQVAVQALAERLIAALREAHPVGLDIGRLEALAVKLGSIQVTRGTGVRIGEARVRGKFEVGDIKVGKAGGRMDTAPASGPSTAGNSQAGRPGKK